MSTSTASHVDTTTLVQTNGKRKRVISPEDVKVPTSNNGVREEHFDSFHSLLEDILVILRRSASLAVIWLDCLWCHWPQAENEANNPLPRSRDAIPSLLDYPISSNTEEGHAAKRTKLTDPAARLTVASKIGSHTYSTIEELIADVDQAVSTIISDLSDQGNSNDGQALSTYARENHPKVIRAKALQKELDNILLREIVQRPKVLRTTTEADSNLHHEDVLGERKRKKPGSAVGENSVGRTVLTLFGGAPQPKQLFSSLQQATPIKLEQAEEMGMTGGLSDDRSPIVYAPLRELSLPNGISTTRVVPVHCTSSHEGKKAIATIGELFAPPSTLTPLNPPRQSRHTATRSSSVNWFNTPEVPPPGKGHRKESYSNQPLTTPQWLTYNIAPPPKELSSPEAKRKQRDRALSIGETQNALSQEAIAEHQQAKEDALFRSVYSSFAPDRDNAAALVSERTKNKIWWKRVGESRYRGLSAFGHSEAVDSHVNGIADYDVADEDVSLKEAVDNWRPEDLPTEMKKSVDRSTETPQTAKEVEEILQEISELLETLNSYQRVRNLSLSSNTRAIAGQNSQSAATSGSPTSPSDAEYDIYEMLRSQLAIMVKMLPPYALAKLDGEKLGILNVNTKIQIEGKNYKGAMEDDDMTTKARLSTTTGYSGRSLNTNTSMPPRSAGYHQTTTPVPASRSSYAPQPTVPRPATGSAAYLPNQQYSSRPPSSNHYFSGNSRSSFPQQRPAASASERYSYSASQVYSPQPPPSSHSQYTNGNRQHPATNGSSYGQQYSTPQHGGASVPAQGSQQRPSQPGYQQRAMNSQGYGYTPAGPGRSASPPKGASAYTPPHQQSSTYSTHGSTPSQQRPQLYHQHSSQYGGQGSTPTTTNGTNPAGSDTQRTYMTANEQAVLMNRQKVQLAEQQSPSTGQGPSTPQPVNGLYGSQPNGTPLAQQNGLTAGQGQ